MRQHYITALQMDRVFVLWITDRMAGCISINHVKWCAQI